MRAVKFLALVAVTTLTACSPKAVTLDLAPATVTFAKKDDTKVLVASPKDAEGKKVENVQVAFASSDAKIASVDATGKVTAVDSGDATIVATLDQITASASVKVSIPASISFAPASAKLEGVGAKANVVAKVMDGKGRPVKGAVAWTVVDGKVAAVANGEITAVGAGETDVVAQMGDVKAQFKVTVVVPVVATVETEKALELAAAGETAAIKPVGKDADGKEVAAATFTFASADEKVATVDAAGTVTAVKKGKTQVTVTSADKSATVEITVKK